MKFFMFLAGMHLLMDEAGDDKGGGGGSGDKGKGDDKGKGTVTLSQEQFDSIMARLPAADKGKKKATDGDDSENDDEGDDLATKAKKASDEKAKKGSDSKALESALRFTMGSAEWLKTNASLLPKDVEGIFAAAEKESYDDAVQKASAVKSGLIQTFFKVQENLDLLTGAQKTALEDWQKLTKNGKEEKAQAVFDNIFEPTFEMLKRIKKAAQVNKGGQREGDDAENAYKQKLMNSSKKHYLGGKQNA